MCFFQIWEFYEATAGEHRDKAREGLKGGCRHFIGAAIGKENSAEVGISKNLRIGRII